MGERGGCRGIPGMVGCGGSGGVPKTPHPGRVNPPYEAALAFDFPFSEIYDKKQRMNINIIYDHDYLMAAVRRARRARRMG
jgi:hypothetical protein